VRSHWTIAHRSYRVRDVTFDENRGQVRTANIPHRPAMPRNLVVGLLRQLGERTVAAARRAWSAGPSGASRRHGATAED